MIEEKFKQNGSSNIDANMVSQINPLIEMSFGKGWKGNYDCWSFDLVDLVEEVDKPLGIAKKYRIGSFFIGHQAVGVLGTENLPRTDGSLIVVFPNYEEKAKKYAELYKRFFHKEVKIILAKEINQHMDVFKDYFKK